MYTQILAMPDFVAACCKTRQDTAFLLLLLQVRVPRVSIAGVTSTCRIALLTLAVMDSMKHLLAAKGMLEVGASCVTWMATVHLV